MRAFLRTGFMLGIVVAWAAGTSTAQEGLTKRDTRGPVSVTVTLTAPPEAGVPVTARVVLDTHSVGLDDIALDQAVVMLNLDGTDLAPTAVEQAQGGSHHRQAVLVFPPLASAGPLKIVVRNVGGVAERSFVWELTPAR